MIERRRHERTSTSIRVEMTHPTMGLIIGFTTDISDGGVQATIENQHILPIGTEVSVMFKKIMGPINSQPVKMRVVRQFRNNVGLLFSS